MFELTAKVVHEICNARSHRDLQETVVAGLDGIREMQAGGSKMQSDFAHATSIVRTVADAHERSLKKNPANLASEWNNEFSELTDIQKNVFKWMAAGKSNSEIAVILAKSKRGVDYHATEIFRKLEITSRT